MVITPCLVGNVHSSYSSKHILFGVSKGVVRSIGSHSVLFSYVSFGKKYGYEVGGSFLVDEKTKAVGVMSSFSIGTKTEIFKKLWLSAFTGVQLQSFKDELNGSYGQFTHNAKVIFKGDNGVDFFVGVRHISNAGIVKPNIGRNVIDFGFIY